MVFVEGALPGRARRASASSQTKPKFDIGARTLDPASPPPAGASRAARISASAAAAPRSTPTRARRWPPSSAGWRTTSRASARSSPRRMLPIVYGEEWGYRRRARLSVRHVDKKGGAMVGLPRAALDLRRRHARVPRAAASGLRADPAAARAGRKRSRSASACRRSRSRWATTPPCWCSATCCR